ncbi:Imm44 family immunity protein [Leptospira noguchii]|uniref:Imm44 family immunity protein n=1 Tax=Leptospira noguchii TaxID=28182 RepID=UPI001F0579D4|nr:Imm44 family immunity protein [Leptospira noguchii]MCH1913708.1 Imm44 family immunity protein [Leptospira noguchii]MCH1914994.1 Imm44 family immunity protein [Leptospira noguchii]UOG64907.1 Imm44 family immunity protein [Leptospira noguchii]
MKFFISSEIDGRFNQNVPDKFRRIRKSVESILNKHFLDKDYGANIQSIGVIPIIIRTDLKEFYKERRLYQKKQKSVDYRLYINFENFEKANDKTAINLLVQNILVVVQDLGRKVSSFDATSVENEIRNLFPPI